jgi:hemoglobin-like flavoprotein
MLSDAEKKAIRETWQLVLPVAETAADLFYRRLAEQNPELRAKSQDQLSAQRKEFVTTFTFVARSLDWEASDWRSEAPDDNDLFLAMLALGQRGTPLARLFEEHYSTTGETLLWTLTYALGKRFDTKARAAWMRLYTLLANAARLGRLASIEEPRRKVVRQAKHEPNEGLGSARAAAQTRSPPRERKDPSASKSTPIARVRRGASS